MKHLSLFITLFLFTHFSLAQQPATLERVGSEIDSDERMYFGLFPKIVGFTSADVRENSRDAMAIVFHRDGTNDTTITLDAALVANLNGYFLHFEKFADDLPSSMQSAAFEPFIPLVQRGIVHPMPRYTNDPEEIDIKTGGVWNHGVLLFASDSVLIWSSGIVSATAIIPATDLHRADVSSIDSITILGVRSGEYLLESAFAPALGVALYSVIFTSPPKSTSGTHYDEWVPPIIVTSVLSGIAGALIGELFFPALGPTLAIAFEGDRSQFASRVRELRHRAVFPDKLPPEVSRLIRGR